MECAHRTSKQNITNIWNYIYKQKKNVLHSFSNMITETLLEKNVCTIILSVLIFEKGTKTIFKWFPNQFIICDKLIFLDLFGKATQKFSQI